METAEQRKHPVDLNRIDRVNEDVAETVHDLFQYHQWDSQQIDRGGRVRKDLEHAVMSIINNVPPCPQRTRAINHIIDARMLANAAITHGGRY